VFVGVSEYQIATKDLARLWLSFLCYTISTSMSGPLIALHAHNLGASPSEIGIIYGIAAATTFVSRLPLASLQAKVGSQLLIRAGVFVNSVSLLVYTLSPTFRYMYLGSFLRGIGFASFHPPMLSEVVRLSGKQQRLGWVMTAPPIGMSLGPVVSSVLLSLFNDILGRSHAYGAVFLSGACLSGLASLLPSRGDEGGELNVTQRADISKILERDMVLLVSSRLVLSYVIGAVSATLPIYVVKGGILPENEVPLVFAWSSIFNVLGRPLSSTLRSPFRGILAGSVSMTIAGVLFLNTDLVSIYGAMAFYGLALGLYIPSSLLMVQILMSGTQLTMGIAVLTLAIDLGTSLGGFGTGLLMESLDAAPLLAISATVAGLASLLLTYSLRTRKALERV